MFLRSTPLPDYLEEALRPFEWSAVFSSKFRDDIVSVIMAANRKDVAPKLVASIRTLKFLDADYVEQLTAALLRFGEEGFPK